MYKDGKDFIIFQSPQPKQESEMDAFDPITNEINWDCPCIQPLLKPPCGSLFKAAFSCFVYSKQEPRGSDCLQEFKEMQSCFQKYPELYGEGDDD